MTFTWPKLRPLPAVPAFSPDLHAYPGIADAEQTPYTHEQIHAMLDCTSDDPCPYCIVKAEHDKDQATLDNALTNFIETFAKGRDTT